MSNSIQICSLDELNIELTDDIRQHLSSQYPEDDGLEAILRAMKRPPANTICRVNQILSSREEVIDGLRHATAKFPQLQVVEHDVFDDVVCILPNNNNSSNHEPTTTTNEKSLCASRVPNGEIIYPKWPARKEKGWPMTHRVVMCDRICGEAVLRGADIFVRGVVAADSGVQAGDTVAVYADIRGFDAKSLPRGLVLDQYKTGTCVFLGLGTAACDRKEFFNSSQGVAIHMSQDQSERAGPCLPPLSGILVDKLMLQNLPSIVVGHVLDPHPHDIILDMCCAPGGKSAHLASLVRNEATIVSCDKSRKKMIATRELFQRFGATCITPLALDSTKMCVQRKGPADQSKTVREIIDSAEASEKDGLKRIKQFYPETFDRIVLDPPCSALGLRPRLFVEQETLQDLEKYANFQKKFVGEAVTLLKQGGFMTYSTCTINSAENEVMVHHILDVYPCMELFPINCTLGRPGLPGFGLRDEERDKVRRFDPHDEEADTMGFFVALFRKKRADSVSCP